jgi:hypothetical protein
MKTSLSLKMLVVLIGLSICTPAAIADPNYKHYKSGHHASKHYTKAVKKSYHRNRKYNQRNRKYVHKAVRQDINNSWRWDKHNWNEQRAYMRSNWGARRARMNAAQQQQLDAQLQAQWLAYNNNNWNGQYTWDQYSDPQFLDYIHNNNPSVLTTIRSYLGF